MQIDEHQMELAAAQEQAERDQAVAAARCRPVEQPVYDGAGYRVCKQCADRIPVERLQAAPDAVRCTYCESLQERWGR